MNTLCKKFRGNTPTTGTIFSRFFEQKQVIKTNKKRFLKSVLCALIISVTFQNTNAQLASEPLRVDPTAIITKGSVEGTSVITDDFGQVFIEIPERTYIAHKNDRTGFTGEIMPPKEITIPDQTPKTRMREVFSFEFVADAGETLVFSDKINTLPPRQKLRLAKLNDGKPLDGAPKPKLIYILEDENVQLPKLWRFIDTETGWQRIGGLTKELDGTRRIFSVYLSQTGKYSIIDENPKPVEIPAEMRQDPTYESIDSIEAKINELEQIRNEIIAREEGLLFENETGFTPEFLDENFDIDNMSDEEFFDAFFNDEDFDLLESEASDGNTIDPDPWAENFVVPNVEDQDTLSDPIPAEFLTTDDQPLPAIGSTTNQNILSPDTPINNNPAPENFVPQVNQNISDQTPETRTSEINTAINHYITPNNQELPELLPATGDTKTIIQKIWDGFKALFILFVLLGLPGYYLSKKFLKKTVS